MPFVGCYSHLCVCVGGGYAVAQLAGHCATSWKVTGSISVEIIGIFHLLNPSGRTMALASTQPLKEMSTRDLPWGVKAIGA